MWFHGSICHCPSKILHLKALYKGEVSSAAVNVLVSSLFQPTKWIFPKARDNDCTWFTLKLSTAPTFLHHTFHCLLAEMLPKFFPPVKILSSYFCSFALTAAELHWQEKVRKAEFHDHTWSGPSTCNISGDLMLCMQCINHRLYGCSCINAIPVPYTSPKASFRKIISMG